MLYYLIVCRSLTYAQRTAAALERTGITARVLRSPKSIAGEGCSHSVKISQRSLPEALLVLQRADLTPNRIFITAGAGSYQEVELLSIWTAQPPPCKSRRKWPSPPPGPSAGWPVPDGADTGRPWRQPA